MDQHKQEHLKVRQEEESGYFTRLRAAATGRGDGKRVASRLGSDVVRVAAEV